MKLVQLPNGDWIDPSEITMLVASDTTEYGHGGFSCGECKMNDKELIEQMRLLLQEVIDNDECAALENASNIDGDLRRRIYDAMRLADEIVVEHDKAAAQLSDAK